MEVILQVIAPPQIEDSDNKIVLDIIRGSIATMECPVVAPIGMTDIEWLKEGKKLVDLFYFKNKK